jgi:prevent-host-death family protein
VAAGVLGLGVGGRSIEEEPDDLCFGVDWAEAHHDVYVQSDGPVSSGCTSKPLPSKYLPILLAMDELPLADARNRLSELVAEVEKTHARVTITKHGHPAAVLVSPQDLASLEETLDILSDPEALAGIREAEAQYARGDVTTGEEMARLIEERRRRKSGAA